MALLSTIPRAVRAFKDFPLSIYLDLVLPVFLPPCKPCWARFEFRYLRDEPESV